MAGQQQTPEDIKKLYSKYNIPDPNNFQASDKAVIHKTQQELVAEQNRSGITQAGYFSRQFPDEAKSQAPVFGKTYGQPDPAGQNSRPKKTYEPHPSSLPPRSENNPKSAVYEPKDQIMFDYRGNAYKITNKQGQAITNNDDVLSGQVENMNLEDFTEFQQAFLARHNFYRQQHQVGDLVLKQTLCESAQKWADTLAESGQLARSSKDGGRDFTINENIYAMKSNNPNIEISAEQVADHWYSEVDKYKFADSDFEIYRNFQNIGHFSQMVWKKTTSLGVGYGKKDGSVFVVAHYHPAGNVGMHFKANVFDKKG